MKNSPSIEPLESRIAPAVVVSPTDSTVAHYTDIDGDLVTIKVSHGDLSHAVFSASANGNLLSMQLTALEFEGADVTFTVKKDPQFGDGMATLGYLNATGIDLGKVAIAGDLGVIDAGSGSATMPAVKSLTVRSMGLYGLATGAPNLQSDIKGELGSLTVATDVKGAYIRVLNGTSTDAKIGAVKIGGSLLGGSTSNTGEIFGSAGIGDVTIGGNVVGGAGDYSGLITVNTAEIGNVTIGGSLLGGAGASSGEILNIAGGIGAVKIGGNLHGDLGAESGKIDVMTNLASLTVGGSIVGGAGAENTYTDSAMVLHAGQVFASIIGPVKIAHDLHGGTGAHTGEIHGMWGIGDVTIGGSVLDGPAGSDSGVIFSGSSIGFIKIGHDVRGTLTGGGRIHAYDNIAGLTIGGSLIGGAGDRSGEVDTGKIGPVTIGHDVLGGAGAMSGYIELNNGMVPLILNATIGGSLVGGAGMSSGGIDSLGPIGKLKIGRDLLGASISTGASTVTNSGFIHASRIDSVEIDGSIFSGIDNSSAGSLVNNASIRSDSSIGTLTVKGDIAGNHVGADLSPVIISAQSQFPTGTAVDLTIGKITVGHRIEEAKILAGYNITLAPKNGNAQIGTVTVGGDWIGSDLVAGASNLGSGTGNFGDGDDAAISGAGTTNSVGRSSLIGSLTIAGRAQGTPTATDNRHFGFVAEEVGKLKILGHDFGLQTGVAEGFRIGAFAYLALHEVESSVHLLSGSGAATLVGNNTVTYTDPDGDFVTVKLSKPVLTDANVNNVFKFSSGTVGDASTLARQLQEIDLTQTGLPATGVSVTVTAKRGATGDGLADVGYIQATDFDIGSVSISGDLGRIDAYKVKSVKARTLGRLGLATSGSFVTDLISKVTDTLGSVTVAADINDAGFLVSGFSGNTTTGAVTIGGSMVGGQLYVLGTLGAVKIGGSLIGGKTAYSGSVFNTIGGTSSVTIGGSVLGGLTDVTGEILSKEAGGAVKIAGSLLGGLSKNSGLVTGNVRGAVTIGGSVLGSAFTLAGAVSIGGDAGALKVGHNLVGAAAESAGYLRANSFKGVTVGGSIVGGFSGISASFGTGAIKIGHNVLGGGNNSGFVYGDTVASVTIGGSLLGGTGSGTGTVIASNTLGPVKIGHDVAGNPTSSNAYIGTTGDHLLKSVTIGGSLLGGTGSYSGSIFTHGDVGAVKIGRDLIGGSIDGSVASVLYSGSIVTDGRIASVTVGGSMVAGLDRSSGGSLMGSAAVAANEDLGSLKVTGSLLGRATAQGSTAVLISGLGPDSLGSSGGVAIGSVSVGGLVSLANIEAGFGINFLPNSGSAQIGAIKVGGNWLASNAIAGVQNYGADHAQGGGDDNLNFGDADDHIIGASQPFSKIASIVIGGIVAGTYGGSDHFGFVSHAIGSFKSAGYKAPLTSGLDPLTALVVGTGDVALHEV